MPFKRSPNSSHGPTWRGGSVVGRACTVKHLARRLSASWSATSRPTPSHPGPTSATSTSRSRTSDRALVFYCGVLGFELMIRYGPQAAFVSAGGTTTTSLSTPGKAKGVAAAAGAVGAVSRGDPLPDAPGPRGGPPPGAGGRHAAPGRSGSRGERVDLFRGPGPERPRAVLGPAPRGLAAPGRTACQPSPPTRSTSKSCCGAETRPRPDPSLRAAPPSAAPGRGRSRLRSGGGRRGGRWR